MVTCRAISFAAALVLLVLSSLAPPAQATSINTYSLSLNTGWFGIDTIPPFPITPVSTTFEASFTGVVENDGRMNLSGLTSFHLSTNLGVTPIEGERPGLQFFSYDTAAGVSTFGFIDNVGGLYACVGAATVLSPLCNGASVLLPPTAHADLSVSGRPLKFSTDFPTLTLVSSVSTVPEPSTGALMLLGVMGLGVGAYWRSTQRAARP